MAIDKNGKRIQEGNFVFDTYSGEYGNVLFADDEDFGDVKVEFLEGEDYCPACEVEIVSKTPRKKIEIIGLFEWGP